MSDMMDIKCTCGEKRTLERTGNIGEIKDKTGFYPLMDIRNGMVVWTCTTCMRTINGAYSILIGVLGGELAGYIHHSTPIRALAKSEETAREKLLTGVFNACNCCETHRSDGWHMSDCPKRSG